MLFNGGIVRIVFSAWICMCILSHHRVFIFTTSFSSLFRSCVLFHPPFARGSWWTRSLARRKLKKSRTACCSSELTVRARGYFSWLVGHHRKGKSLFLTSSTTRGLYPCIDFLVERQPLSCATPHLPCFRRRPAGTWATCPCPPLRFEFNGGVRRYANIRSCLWVGCSGAQQVQCLQIGSTI